MKMYVCMCVCVPVLTHRRWSTDMLGRGVFQREQMYKGLEIKEGMACLGSSILWSVA